MEGFKQGRVWELAREEIDRLKKRGVRFISDTAELKHREMMASLLRVRSGQLPKKVHPEVATRALLALSIIRGSAAEQNVIDQLQITRPADIIRYAGDTLADELFWRRRVKEVGYQTLAQQQRTLVEHIHKAYTVPVD